MGRNGIVNLISPFLIFFLLLSALKKKDRMLVTYQYLIGIEYLREVDFAIYFSVLCILKSKITSIAISQVYLV